MLTIFLGLKLPLLQMDIISFRKYPLDLLSRAGLTDSKIAIKPLQYNAHFNLVDGVLLADATLYRQLVRNLIYLTITHPNTTGHMFSQYIHQP